MGGNTWYWRVAFNPSVPGVMEVRRNEDGTRAWAAEPGEYYHSFTGEYGGLWRRQGRPPQMIAGNGFIAQGFDDSSYYLRQEGSFDPRARFIFEGIADDERIGDFGLVGNGAAGLSWIMSIACWAARRTRWCWRPRPAIPTSTRWWPRKSSSTTQAPAAPSARW